MKDNFGNLLWKLYESSDADHRAAAAIMDNDRHAITAATRTLVKVLGSVGPVSLGSAVDRAVRRIQDLERRLQHQGRAGDA